LVRAARDAAVRRFAPADLAARVQRRRRAGTAARARRAGAGAAAALPVSRGGPAGDDRPVGLRGAHRVALDGRSLGSPEAIRLAGPRRRHGDVGRAGTDRPGGGRCRRLADRCKLTALRAEVGGAMSEARGARNIGVTMTRLAFRSMFVIVLVVAGVAVSTVRPSGQARPAAGFVASTKNGDWPSYTGHTRGSRYSPLAQITAANFNDLEVAWRFKTDNLGSRPEYKLEGPRLAVNVVVYTTAGTRRSVIALDGATGELMWVHRYPEGVRGTHAPRQLSGRGLAYWTDGRGDERIIYVTPGYRMIALDARTGQPVKTFGKDGVLD